MASNVGGRALGEKGRGPGQGGARRCQNRPPVWRAVLIFVFLTAGCVATAEPPRSCQSIRIDAATICVELAITDEEVQRGLMGRPAMGADEGMLFIYAVPRRLSFWMKDTVLRLEIGYFDAAGVLREIYPLAPLDLTPVISASARIRFALELPRGGFARWGLAIGARMDLASVDAALAARGGTVSVQP